MLGWFENNFLFVFLSTRDTFKSLLVMYSFLPTSTRPYPVPMYNIQARKPCKNQKRLIYASGQCSKQVSFKQSINPTPLR